VNYSGWLISGCKGMIAYLIQHTSKTFKAEFVSRTSLHPSAPLIERRPLTAAAAQPPLRMLESIGAVAHLLMPLNSRRKSMIDCERSLMR
jgi:hypothetical protein